MWPAVALILAGLAALFIGGQLSVRSAVEIARTLGASETLIGLTVLALGTSLPELATSSVAAYRKSPDIAVGNIVGSNIFNIFFVLGIPAVLYRIPFDPDANFDMLAMNLATLMLFVFMFVGRPRMMIQRSQGVLFLVLYGLYLTFIVQRG
jgi:cation:H+ antiporter